MCLSQESLERAGVRQELMPFVYKLTKFSFEFTVQDVVAIFEHVTLLTLRVGLELFCSFFLMNLKDALHNFNIGSIQ